MISNTIYTPYFYIIRHIKSGMMYAGSRWAKGCHPDEFMKLGGYTTSSPSIRFIIESEGIQAFEVLRIDTNCDGLSVYEYESLFLKCLNCSSSTSWINAHNNDIGSAIDSDKNKQIMLLKYGVNNVSQSPVIKEKKRKTCLKNHGVEHPAQSLITKENVKKNSMKRHGTESPNSAPKVKEKKKILCLEKYGVENVFQLSETKNTIRKTIGLKYGVNNVSQSPMIKEKKRKTCLLSSGFDHPSKVPFFSIIETRKTYSKNILSKCFPDFKKYY